MTELAKVDARGARAVAGQIRQGIRDYLSTLALVKRAWDEEHWRILGYDAWQDYIDSEFGADRLGLPLEHRDKALNDLRLSGMSVRAIAATTGVPKSTVADELNRLSGAGQLEQPDAVRSLDGRERPATRPSPPTGTDAIASSAALRTRPDRSGPGEVEPASEGGCGSTSSSDAGVNPALVEALAKAAQRRDEIERHNAWARDVNEQIPAETKAELAELDRVIAPVNRITNGCAFLLDVVKDVNPELAVAETPEQLRHKLAVVHDALAFLTRVADAMKPQEIAA